MCSVEGQRGEESSGGTASPVPVPVPVPPHVLIFPFPVQGHITPMLKLAELLSLAGIRVTFLNSDHNQRRLFRSAGVRQRLSRRPGLHFRSIPDGLPEENPRDAGQGMEMIDAFDATGPSLLREILASGGTDSDAAPPVTCVVADGLIRFAVEVAEEVGVPIIGFLTCSACSAWANLRIPELIARGIVPFQDGCDLDELVACVPGTESFLRRRDLPGFCRAKATDDPVLRVLDKMNQNATRCRGLVLNTTEIAESSVLTHIRGLIPSTYTIGPLHGLLQAVEHSSGALGVDVGDGVPCSDSTSLRQEDRACIDWLNARLPASVVYVSFGSMALLKREELLQVWHGLVNSGYHFLWVMRPGLVDGGGDSGVPAEVAEGTAERGFLVEWAPQEAVLSHPAVGCFLTHSGWNSTVESLWAGVPMVCWPGFADQQINSRFVSEVWRVGVDVKDTCDGAAVEKAVREVMAGDRASKMREAAAGISKMTRECVVEGGSSRINLERLIGDIRTMVSSE